MQKAHIKKNKINNSKKNFVLFLFSDYYFFLVGWWGGVAMAAVVERFCQLVISLANLSFFSRNTDGAPFAHIGVCSVRLMVECGSGRRQNPGGSIFWPKSARGWSHSWSNLSHSSTKNQKSPNRCRQISKGAKMVSPNFEGGHVVSPNFEGRHQQKPAQKHSFSLGNVNFFEKWKMVNMVSPNFEGGKDCVAKFRRQNAQ